MKKFDYGNNSSFLNSCLSPKLKYPVNIKDNKGKPIAGVSITLKDTYDGAVLIRLVIIVFLQQKKAAT